MWSDINQEDPTHVINLADAKLEKRLPDLKIDDKVWVKPREHGNRWFSAHFNSWREDGRMLVWAYGRSSHTAVSEQHTRIPYDWSLVNPETNGGKLKKQ